MGNGDKEQGMGNRRWGWRTVIEDKEWGIKSEDGA